MTGSRSRARSIEEAALAEELAQPRPPAFEMEPAFSKFLNSRKRYNAIVGGLGAGKSTALILKTYANIACNPWGLRHGIAGQTAGTTQDILEPMWFDLLQELGVRYVWRAQRRLCVLQDGSSLQFLSGENYRRWPGRTFATMALDECGLQEAGAFKQAVQRTRAGRAIYGQVACGGTPEGFTWFYDEFGQVDDGDPEHDVTFVETDINAKRLRAGYAEELERIYGPKLAEQYRRGRFINARAGRVYAGADRDKYSKKGEYDPERALTIALDFNVDPGVATLGHRDADVDHIFGEVFIRDSNTSMVCAEIRSRFPCHKGPVRIYGDATGGARHSSSTRTNWQVVKDELNAHFQKSSESGEDPEYKLRGDNPNEIDRVNAVNRRFELDRVKIDLASCPNLVRDLDQVVWKEGTLKLDKSSRSPEAKRLTHISDALGYMLHYEYPIHLRTWAATREARY